MSEVYLLGSSTPELSRLELQHEVLSGQMDDLIDEALSGIGVGRPYDESFWTAVDLGCGPGHTSEQLGGVFNVTGVDTSAEMLRLAEERNSHLEFDAVQADATATGLESDSFEVAHARLLLVNVPDPAAIVREAMRLVKPGGMVLLQEVDARSWFCSPTCPEWDELMGLVESAFRSVGSDSSVGSKLGPMLVDAGLNGVNVQFWAQSCPPGHVWRDVLDHFAGLLAPKLVASGAVSQEKLEALRAGLRAHLARPDVFVSAPLLCQAWGTK